MRTCESVPSRGRGPAVGADQARRPGPREGAGQAERLHSSLVSAGMPRAAAPAPRARSLLSWPPPAPVPPAAPARLAKR